MRLHAPASSAGVSTAPQVFKAFCAVSDSVGDAVYTSTDKVFDLPRVGRVDINDSAKNPAVGVIVKKFSSTECLVQISGVVRDVFTGLTFGKHLFVDSPSGLTQTPPSSPPSGRRLIQAVGYAIASDEIVIQIMLPMYKVSS